MTLKGVRAKTKTWLEMIDHILFKTRKENDNDFKEWISKREHIGYCVDPLTYRYTYNIYKELKDDNDHITVIVGREGAGKSRCALSYCALVSPNFSMNHVCYKPEHFFKAIKISKPGDTILIDEGALFLFSRNAMGSDNKDIVQILTICRQMNLHIVICIPNFWILDSYVRDHRVKTLINVFERGSFTAYFGRAIKVISKCGAQYKTITQDIKTMPSQRWIGHFVKDVPKVNDITEEKYLDFKKEVMLEFLQEQEDKLEERNNNKDSKFIKVATAARELSCDTGTIRKRIKKGELKGKKIGGNYYVDRKSFQNDINIPD